jgi:hypothetical protein
LERAPESNVQTNAKSRNRQIRPRLTALARMRQTQTPHPRARPGAAAGRARVRGRASRPPRCRARGGRSLSVRRFAPSHARVASPCWSRSCRSRGAARREHCHPGIASGDGHNPGEARVDDVNDDRGLRREHAASRPLARPSFFGSKLGHSMHVSTICGTQHRAIGRQQEAQHTQ